MSGSAYTPHFRVVRFRGIGTREYQQLAFCIPRSDVETVHIIYADRATDCAVQLLVKADVVNVNSMMSKVYIMCAVQRDYASIRAKLQGYGYDDVSHAVRAWHWHKLHALVT